MNIYNKHECNSCLRDRHLALANAAHDLALARLAIAADLARVADCHRGACIADKVLHPQLSVSPGTPRHIIQIHSKFVTTNDPATPITSTGANYAIE